MRILFVANKDITLFLFRRELIEKLIDLHHEIYLLCPYGEKLEYFENKGCKLFDYAIDRKGVNPFKEIKVLFRFLKAIKKINPDYIFTYTIKPNIYVGIISRFKRIDFIPTITGLGRAFNGESINETFIHVLYKISFKNAYTVVFQNSFIKNWFFEKINKKVPTLLVNGSGVNLLDYQYESFNESKKTTFLYLGRIMREKGIDELISAAKLLKENYGKGVSIQIAGFHEEGYEKIIETLQKQEIIEYLGYLENPIEAIKNCSSIVLPSYHEGLSNVLLEAQAVGRPVIASNIPGCKETFIDGVSGFSVRVKDFMNLYENMKKYHLLPFKDKQKMGIEGRHYIETNFNRNEIVDQYIGIISRRIKI